MRGKCTDIDDHMVFNVNKCFHLEDERQRHREKFVVARDRHDIPPHSPVQKYFSPQSRNKKRKQIKDVTLPITQFVFQCEHNNFS